jgi:CTD small phosphatase-like protein 2
MRPNLIEFLDEMSKNYELIVYTASEKNYADSVVNFIEKNKKYFSYRLYKQQCIVKTGEYSFKNLEVLCENRNLGQVLLVDNSVRNFALSVRNGIPIKEYKGNNHNDKELIYLAKYMRELTKEEDVRVKIKEDFASFLIEHYQSS